MASNMSILGTARAMQQSILEVILRAVLNHILLHYPAGTEWEQYPASIFCGMNGAHSFDSCEIDQS